MTVVTSHTDSWVIDVGLAGLVYLRQSQSRTTLNVSLRNILFLCLSCAAQMSIAQVQYYYDPEDVTEDVRSILATGDSIQVQRVLQQNGLAVIVYNNRQHIIAPLSEVNTELSSWQRRAQLRRQEESAGPEVVIIGDPNSMSSDEARITGKVFNVTTGEPVVGATVLSGVSGMGAATDIDGGFEIVVPVGQDTLEIRSIGFATTNLNVLVFSDASVEIPLEEGAVRLEEVIVSEKAPDDNIKSAISGIERLEMREMRKLPSLLGETDVLKSLLTLPGVSSAGDGVAGINVRGGNVDHNLIEQDGIIYFNPTHALGFFSLFHPDMVDEAELYKGHMPARFGGRLSSVLDVSTRTGSNEEWKLKGGVGTVASKLAVEGPVFNDKTTLLVGGRFAYPDWILRRVNVPEVKNSSAFFYDVQGKLEQRVTQRAAIGIQGYYGFDKFRFSNEAEFQYASGTASIYYRQLLGEHTNLSVRATFSDYTSDLFDLQPEDGSTFNTAIQYLKGSIDLVTQLTGSNRLAYGAEVIRYSINPGEINPSDGDSEVTPEAAIEDIGIEMGAYLEYQFEIRELIEITAGARVSGLLSMGPETVNMYQDDILLPNYVIGQTEYQEGEIVKSYFGFEPRVGLKVDIGAQSSIKASYNRTYQYLSLISNTVAATPVDFWKLSDYHIKPQSAHNYSLGYYRNFNNNMWATFIEGYYRTIDNTPEYRDFPDLIVNDHLETELLAAEGKSYGVEFSVKKNIGRVTGRMSMTWSRALRRVMDEDQRFELNDGDWYPSNFDKPFSANVVFNYNFSQRISLNMFFTYSTGRPITAPESKYRDWNILNVPVYSERNQYRIPDYHRLDVSLTILPGYRKDRKWKSSWTFAIFNLYGRNNAYSVYFRQEPFQQLTAYKLSVLGSILPSITYNFEF